MNEIMTILGALTKAEVRFLVAGGVAVVLHGYPRLTADLDVILELESPNILRAIEALEALDYRPRAPVAARSFADAALRQAWVEEKGMRVFSMWSSRLKGTEVDIFAEEPIPFLQAWQRSESLTIAGVSFRVLALEDLIALKSAAGREKDLLDVAMLRRLQLKRTSS